MQTPIYSLTETEAVNRILSTVGGEKVADLKSLSLTADSAYTHLRDSLRDLQSHPWGFNTQKDVELEADGHGRIVFDSGNYAGGGPNDFVKSDTTWHWGTGTTMGKDGTPGPLGYGHAHHFGNHTDVSDNTYLYHDLLATVFEDETYYTASVYIKYHSSPTTTVQIWDNEDPNNETKSSASITWNTDGTIASTTFNVTGVEGGDDAAAADTTTPPLADASIKAVGKGWHRMICTAKVEHEHFTTRLKFQINPRKADTFGSTYLWGAQIVKYPYVLPFEQERYRSRFIAAVDLTPESAGNLDVVLRTDESQNALAIADIDPMLFDKTSNSFNAFSGKYKANITYYLSFEDCPEVVKIYATTLAAANFQAAQVGNPQMDAILRGHVIAAKANFESYEAAQESWSIFENYDVWKLLSPFNRPGLGGGTRSSWGSSLG